MAAVDDFNAQLSAGDYSNLQDIVQTVTKKLEELENVFDKREEVIIGVTQ
jgi:hypothetical protein